MKRILIIISVCCGLAWPAFAGSNPKLASAIADARKAGLSPSALNMFLSQADGARFSLGITKDILKYATETQKAGAPGNQLLLKASEGVAKGVAHIRIAATVRKQGEELRQIAKSLPANLSDSARRRIIAEKFRAAHHAHEKK